MTNWPTKELSRVCDKEKNKFLKFRNWIEHDVSNKIKFKTGSDLFDWISLFVLFGGGCFLIGYLMYREIISLEISLQGIVLWLTVFVILRYTKETYWLKKIAQEQYITSIRPYLRLQWETTGNLVLVNEGKGVAVNLQPTFKKDREKYPLLQIPAMAAAPGSQTRSFVPSSFVLPLDPNLKNNEYIIEVAYTDIEQRSYIAIFKTNTRVNDSFEIIKQEEKK